jgi:hypothetical protein
LDKNLISTKSLRKLTEYLHLQVSLKRCTHQSIDMVDILTAIQRSPARTPPPTLLFSLHLSKNRCLVPETASCETKKNLKRPDRPCGPSRP